MNYQENNDGFRRDEIQVLPTSSFLQSMNFILSGYQSFPQ
jgi:hypothetical protein